MNPNLPSIPFGLWPSPFSARWAAQKTRLDDVQWSVDGLNLVWLESRPGGAVLVAQGGIDAARDLTFEHSPGGGIGYGGGAFGIGRLSDQDETCPIRSGLVFADRNGCLYRLDLQNERLHPLTSTPGAAAAPIPSPDGRWVVFVASDGRSDRLGLVSTQGRDWPIQLARGADFYMQPTWHPSGDWLAWVEWDHPSMPWESTRLQIARLETDSSSIHPPHLTEARTTAGGPQTPTWQPCFSPDGRWLSYIEESDEWPSLVLLDLQNGRRRVLVKGHGFELAQPAWIQGMRSYGWSPSSQSIYYLRYQGPDASLWVVNLADGQSHQIDTQPYTWITQLSVSPTRDSLAFIASCPHLPDRIVEWDATRPENARMRVVARSGVEFDIPGSLAVPQDLCWQAADGTPVHALYYPPTLLGQSRSGLPPAIVQVHGGPTLVTPSSYNREAIYFTSRGYAFVELNYRGSTGYGRRYRQSLYGGWGKIDVEDAAGCAQALCQNQLADPSRLALCGGSAGGYTVLNTLISHPGLYRAAICKYGVTNLFLIDQTTHKFEKFYNTSLIGPLPEALDRYQSWSPALNASRIQDPICIFQGDTDPVVSPAQAEAIVTALKASGVPYRYKQFSGEGHGFRKTETIIDYLQETEQFLQQHVLFR